MPRLTASFLLLAALSLSALSASAQTVFHYTSEAGDYIGQGQERTLTPAGGYTFQVNGSTANHVGFYITQTSSGYQDYTLDFAAPAGTDLAVGDYPGATRYPFQDTGSPGLDFSANGAGSNTLTGQFQVYEISFDASGNLATFAADFVQHSEGAAPASYGQIRYNSSVPYLNPTGVGQLATSTYSLLETAGSLTVSVTRRGGSTGALSVNYSTADGTDLAGRDYTASAGTIAWANGDTADKTFQIPILNSHDPLQGDGTFLINLSGGGVGAQTQAVVTIVNDNSSVTFLHFISDKGDYIGEGQERTFSIANGYLLTASQDNGGVSFSVADSSTTDIEDEEWWTLDLSAALGTIFGVGDYENAERDAFKSAGHPGLDFYGDGRGSNTLTGDFQVLEAQYDNDGNVLKFAANFVQYSEGGTRALRGEVRYNSTVPLPPEVSVTVVKSLLPAGGGSSAFILTRTGDTSAPLVVEYSVGGTATNGRDYQALTGTKTIKAGKATAKVPVHPLGPGPTDGYLQIRLKVRPEDGTYNATKPGSATITLLPAGSIVPEPDVKPAHVGAR